MLEAEVVRASANRAQENKAYFACRFSAKMRGGGRGQKNRKCREKLDRQPLRDGMNVG